MTDAHSLPAKMLILVCWVKALNFLESEIEILKNLGFESEKQLVQALITCTKHAHQRIYRTELEVDAGVGVADLVLAKRAARSTDGLRALGNVVPRHAVLLKKGVGDTITTLSELADALGVSKNTAQRIIAKLAIADVAKQSHDFLSISTIKTLPFERLIAVEAKISDWQRVLVQAYRNLQFADESWVVLDHAFIRPALVQLERFKVSGVGLASLDRQRGLFIHHAASTQGPMSLGKHWQAQAVLASRILTKRVKSGAG